MLNEFSDFMYELESTYMKELDPNLILSFIEKFYKNFLNKNNGIEPGLLTKTINTIIVAVDSMILQKSPVKEHWIHRTGENYLINMNRGNETIDNTLKDILGGIIVNEELNTIVMIILMSGVESPYKKEFLHFFSHSHLPIMNVENNLKISTINLEKKSRYPLFYIFITTLVVSLILTEIYYFISLSSIVKSIGDFLISIRSSYVV